VRRTANDDKLVVLDQIEHSVRDLAEESPAEVVGEDGIRCRIAGNRIQAVLDGIQEVEAQPGTLLLIPRCGQFHIAFGRTPEYDLHFSS
jgi:hypothetical protein